MKNEIQTNLLGKIVQFTMGLNDEQIKESRPTSVAYWEHLGERCEIVAVYQDKDGELQAMLKLMEGGNMIERCVKYLRMY